MTTNFIYMLFVDGNLVAKGTNGHAFEMTKAMFVAEYEFGRVNVAIVDVEDQVPHIHSVKNPVTGWYEIVYIP